MNDQRVYSHNALKVAQRCMKKWYYSYIEKLEVAEERPYLAAGSRLHSRLESLYGEEFDTEDLTAHEEDIIRRYTEKWDDHEWDVVAVEPEFLMAYNALDGSIVHVDHLEEFSCEIPGIILVIIKPDLLIRVGGKLWVVDHKTTATIPDAWNPYNMTDFQHLIYLAAVQKAYPQETMGGFMFNYVRTKPPTEPKLLKSGAGISYIKTIDTDYDTLYTFAEQHGLLETPEVQHRLHMIDSQPDKFFQRHWLPFNQHAVNEVARDVYEVIKDMAYTEMNGGPYPRHVMSGYAAAASCNRCEFSPICQTDLLGMDREPVLLGYKEKEVRT